MKQTRGSDLSARIAITYLVLVITAALFAPVLTRVLSKSDPLSVHLEERLQGPGGRHLLGTDELGRDLTARILFGARVSLLVGIISAVLSLGVGTLLGAVAGYYRGTPDWIVSRVIEVFLCFPFLFVALAIVGIFHPSVVSIIIAVALTSWPDEARIVRGELFRIREIEFAEAARASGAGDLRLITRHLLPHAIGPALISATFTVGSAILTESALSFLGLGSALPTPSWGGILASASSYGDRGWWLLVFPGIAIFLTVAACNVLGESLRDRLDPRS
ncbi:MAG TPA: ABC transporter permease [Thermoanaerobaculia bacterium]|nr:ABC transporter permease [Thermoanaerobaculia bacterium]